MSDDERKHLEGLDEQTERERWEEFHTGTDRVELTEDEREALEDAINESLDTYANALFLIPAVESIVAARVAALTAERDELREQVRGLQAVYTSERLSHIEAFDQRCEFRDIAVSNHALYRSAEDDLRRLRESVAALADAEGGEVADQMRALLADDPQPTKGDDRG